MLLRTILTSLMFFAILFQKAVEAYPTDRKLESAILELQDHSQNDWKILRDHEIPNKYYLFPLTLSILKQSRKEIHNSNESCARVSDFENIQDKVSKILSQKSNILLGQMDFLPEIEKEEKRKGELVLAQAKASNPNEIQKEIDAIEKKLSGLRKALESTKNEITRIDKEIDLLRPDLESLRPFVEETQSEYRAEFKIPGISDFLTQADPILIKMGLSGKNFKFEMVPFVSMEAESHCNSEKTLGKKTWSFESFNIPKSVVQTAKSFREIGAIDLNSNFYFVKTLTLLEYCRERQIDLKNQIGEIFSISGSYPFWRDSLDQLVTDMELFSSEFRIPPKLLTHVKDFLISFESGNSEMDDFDQGHPRNFPKFSAGSFDSEKQHFKLYLGASSKKEGTYEK